jgi:hypothetical protein
MDSHGRQKATHKLLELTKDPDVASIARGLLCEKGAAPVAERAIETKIPRGDWILLLLGIPIAIIFFFVPRNPTAAIAGMVFTFLCSLPALLHLVGRGIVRKLVGSFVLLVVVAALGWVAFHSIVEERNTEITKNQHPSTAIINPADITTTDFSIINDSGTEIISMFKACHINEAFGPSGQWGATDSVRLSVPELVKPGGRCSRYSVFTVPEHIWVCHANHFELCGCNSHDGIHGQQFSNVMQPTRVPFFVDQI